MPFLAVGVGVVACLLPCLVALFIRGDESWLSRCLAFTPLGLIRGESRSNHADAWPLMWLWSAVALTASMPWISAQWSRFVPYPEPKPPMAKALGVTGGLDLAERGQLQEKG